MSSQNCPANGSAMPLRLNDDQIDEQLCYTFTVVRQRLYEKNTIISNLQRSIELERASCVKHYRAIQQELANERGKTLREASQNSNGEQRTPQPIPAEEKPTNIQESPEDQTCIVSKDKQILNSECELASEQAPTDRCDTRSASNEIEQFRRSPQSPLLRQRRLGKRSLANPLTISTRSHASQVLGGVEGLENDCVSGQRKRTKRSRQS